MSQNGQVSAQKYAKILLGENYIENTSKCQNLVEFYWAILKISIFWPKIILKTSKNDQIEVVGHKLLNALYLTW